MPGAGEEAALIPRGAGLLFKGGNSVVFRECTLRFMEELFPLLQPTTTTVGGFFSHIYTQYIMYCYYYLTLVRWWWCFSRVGCTVIAVPGSLFSD